MDRGSTSYYYYAMYVFDSIAKIWRGSSLGNHRTKSILDKMFKFIRQNVLVHLHQIQALLHDFVFSLSSKSAIIGLLRERENNNGNGANRKNDSAKIT